MNSTRAKIVSVGYRKIDAGSFLGQVPQEEWKHYIPTDRKNRMILGLNCLLLESDGKNILVDTGMGSKQEDSEDNEKLGFHHNSLTKKLKGFGLAPNDIETVILTHLHFDHCGGCTRLDRVGNIKPSFPNATYLVQRDCWQDALNPNERSKASYRPENFISLQEQVKLLDGDSEIYPGVSVVVTGGPSRGHQIVKFNHGGEKIVFLGDIIPTPYNLNLPVISAFDYSPEGTLEQKRSILAEAERQSWLLVFSHGHQVKAGYLEQRNGKLSLKPVEL